MALRVFVSSTMKDMANERDAVCRKLREFSMEPVNAEGWLPDGTGSWDRISEELRSSDLFVLLLGESYGWIPTIGPKSETGKAVTEIEYLEAREQEIPVLPFVKNLSYEADRASADAQKRDAFRKCVMDWEGGQFVAKFDLAFDLAEKVAKALIGVVTREYLKARVKKRLAAKNVALGYSPPVPAQVRSLEIPEALIRDVLAHKAVLFAGAGMSIAAGLPTAAAFAEYLRESIREIDPQYSGAGESFAAAAVDFESLASRERLVAKVRDMLDPPQGLEETMAHRIAVRAFDSILTTNWDNLFERALRTERDNRAIVTADLNEKLPAHALVKLHGSLNDVSSLLLTEADVAKMDRVRADLWAESRGLLRDRTIVVVGTSLRDLSIIKLFEEAAPVHGYFVAPHINTATKARLARWNLVCIEATADEFFAALAAYIPRSNNGG